MEACFLNPVPGQTTPLIFKAFNLMAKRSVLFGQSLAVFFAALEAVFVGYYMYTCTCSTTHYGANVHVNVYGANVMNIKAK